MDELLHEVMFTATLKTYIMLFEEETASRTDISICENKYHLYQSSDKL
jgi:hypothetical protein